ncbi:MAG: Uncharacterised protein [Flavobacteriia bacterium]|nr:MAG: Uncharacterised protein [Flavobacteriia bacterium]
MISQGRSARRNSLRAGKVKASVTTEAVTTRIRPTSTKSKLRRPRFIRMKELPQMHASREKISHFRSPRLMADEGMMGTFWAARHLSLQRRNFP